MMASERRERHQKNSETKEEEKKSLAHNTSLSKLEYLVYAKTL